jgi:hypothetical protein
MQILINTALFTIYYYFRCIFKDHKAADLLIILDIHRNIE